MVRSTKTEFEILVQPSQSTEEHIDAITVRKFQFEILYNQKFRTQSVYSQKTQNSKRKLQQYRV